MTGALTILVIDDSPDDRDFYQRTLGKAFGKQLHIVEAASGERGLEAIAQAMPDCVMLDYSLPGQDGLHVLRRIRSQYPHLPVILLTGQGNEAVAVQAMKDGAQDYATKGTLTADTLSRAIRLAIEHGMMRKRIDEQHLALETFAHALTHDLKEPVRTIRSFAQLIDDAATPDTQRSAYVRHICDAGDRMAMLIDTVFVYTQLDGAHMLKMEPCAMTEVLEGTLANLTTLIHERHADISWGPLPVVNASRIHMIQLLQNIISNAIGHSPDGVRIHVSAEPDSTGTVRICVRDNGPGIAPENQKKIFEPFRRLNRDAAHSGLGLATCQKIVELHGGKIGCVSEPGKGAMFFFTVALSDANKTQAAHTELLLPADLAGLSHEESWANVLLVDDMEADIYLTRKFLSEPLGMRCNFFVAFDGKAGLETIDRTASEGRLIDLILLDINMPGMNGFEMLEELQRDARLQRIPVVMCTGSIYEKDKERARLLGAVGYLEKPVQFKHLKPIIESSSTILLHTDQNNAVTLVRAV